MLIINYSIENKVGDAMIRIRTLKLSLQGKKRLKALNRDLTDFSGCEENNR